MFWGKVTKYFYNTHVFLEEVGLSVCWILGKEVQLSYLGLVQ